MNSQNGVTNRKESHMKLGDKTVTVKNNLDELANLLCEAKEVLQKINEFEIEVEVVQEKE